MKYFSCTFALIAFVAQIHSATAAEIVVQAGGTGTAQTGSWSSATDATMPYNGNLGVYTQAGNTATYTFAPTFPQTTTYAVEVYNSCYSPRSHIVTHVINHAGGSATHIIEQDCAVDPYRGQWRPLGSYTFNAGNTGGLTIYSAGSNNSYVGATAVRFIYTPSSNPPPTITPSTTSMNVNEGQVVALSATANDVQDGNLTSAIQWQALGQTGTGPTFSVTAGAVNFVVTLSVTDSQGASSTASVTVNVTPNTPPPTQSQFFGFDCENLEALTGFTTNNASALPNVGKRCGRYTAELLSNDNDVTLHYNTSQGRFDGVLATFPFTAIVRNVGVAPLGQPDVAHEVQYAYNFAGIQIHNSDFNNLNSAHVVVGMRSGTTTTIEGKLTRDGVSTPTDIGQNQLPKGRADIRVVGAANGTLTVYWQQPNLTGNSNNDNWIPYDGTGNLPGALPVWGQSVYIGLITYAYGTSGVPFMGLADSLEIIGQ